MSHKNNITFFSIYFLEGYLTLKDLNEYKTNIHNTPLYSKALPNRYIMCGPPPSSSFVVVQIIVGIMKRMLQIKCFTSFYII